MLIAYAKFKIKWENFFITFINRQAGGYSTLKILYNTKFCTKYKDRQKKRRKSFRNYHYVPSNAYFCTHRIKYNFMIPLIMLPLRLLYFTPLNWIAKEIVSLTSNSVGVLDLLNVKSTVSKTNSCIIKLRYGTLLFKVCKKLTFIKRRTENVAWK